MLTGQSDGRRPTADLSVLGFGLAFVEGCQACVDMQLGWVICSRGSALKHIRGASLAELIQHMRRRTPSSHLVLCRYPTKIPSPWLT